MTRLNLVWAVPLRTQQMLRFGRRHRAVGMRAVRVAALGLALVMGSGCGSGGGLGQPVSEFPSASALEQFADERVNPLPALETTTVEEWRLNTDLPAADDANASWNELLASRISRAEGARASAELSCAAREAARFFVTEGAYPDAGLQEYLAMRCNSTVAQVGIGAAHLEAPADVTESQVRAKLEELAIKSIDQQLEGSNKAMGIGYARGNGRAAVVVYGSSVQAELNEFTPIVTGDQVTVGGRLLGPANSLIGLVNEGQYGVRLCEPDRRLKFPKFKLTCPVGADDELTRIAVMTAESGRVLMSTVARATVRRSEEAGLVYHPPVYGSVQEVPNDAAFQKALLSALNGVRQEAGLGKLRFERSQSTTNRRVAGQFFSEMLTGDTEHVDLIALGVLAGWNVNGMIKNGGVLPGSIANTTSPARWLGEVLADPVGRWVLLDKDAESVAIGGRVLKPSGLIALLTTYSFFDSFDHSEQEQAVFEQLTRARVQQGLAPPTRMANPPEMNEALMQIATGATTTNDALPQAMQAVSQRSQRSVSGWVVETNDLTYLPFADDFMQPGPLEIAVGITHYKPAGAAWAQYVLLFIRAESGGAPRLTARVPSRDSRSRL